MNVNNNAGIKNSFMNRRININEISIANRKSNNKQNSLADNGVILELSSPRVKIENVEQFDNSIEMYFEYTQMFISAESAGLGWEGRMKGIIEKYYDIDNELKEKYAGNEREYNRYKAWLDKAFDEQSSDLIYVTAQYLTYPLMRMGFRTSDSAKRDAIVQIQKEYQNTYQNDIRNMFNNMKNYYDVNKSFDEITSSIISENCVEINYSDVDYILGLNKETQIDDKIKYGYQLLDKDDKLNDEELDEIEDICKDVKNTIENMDCSDIFKQMYRYLLSILQEKMVNRK